MAEMPTPAEIQEMRALGAATLYEAQGSGALHPAIKPIDPGMRVAGPALTVHVPAGDNLALHYAITQAREGQVIVVDYEAHLDVAVTGDIMVAAAMHRKVAGMVVDGAVRDAPEVIGMGFAMFARGLSIVGPQKAKKGTLGQKIKCGGVDVETGDIIVGDQDGVVAIGKAHWREVLDKARARQQKEAGVHAAIKQGKTTVELNGLEDALKRVGMI